MQKGMMTIAGQATKVCSHVFMVGGGGLTDGEDCCVYLVDGGAAAALIDTGAGRSAPDILANIVAAGVEPAAVKYIVVTHGHIDHIGGLKWLTEKLGAQVVAHELERPAIEQIVPRLTAADLYGVDYEPVKVQRVLSGELQTLTVGDRELVCLHTPGHTKGGISLYMDRDGQRVLFGQDIHGPFQRAWGSDLNQWRASMGKLLALKADILCEGHYGVYTPARAVAQYIEDMLRRWERH